MSALRDFIQAHDEATLITALNKGQVIRAKKDVAAGKITLVEETADQARFDVIGEVTTLHAKSLASATCSCSAAGICRHIATAVLFLRETVETPDVTAHEPVRPDFTLHDVEKFAGRDWDRALLASDIYVRLSTLSSITAELTQTRETVAFPVGRPLGDAIFKGPRSTRKRLAISIAALAVLRDHGVELPEPMLVENPTPQADERLIRLAMAALEQAVNALASGNTRQSRERLFSVAITSRAEKLPRLAAELRGLSELLDPDALRRADVTPTDALMRLGRSYALCQALSRHPDDPVLTGIGARSFTPSGPRDFILIGAEDWRTPSGARGFTLTLRDPNSGRFVQTLQARAAGTDLTFHPGDLWYKTLWGGVLPSKHMGAHLHFPDAALSAQGDPGLSQTAEIRNITTEQALQTGDPIDDWQTIDAAVDQHLGQGLRRKIGDAPIILAPTRTDPPYLDEYLQRHVWTWYDNQDHPLTLMLPEKCPGMSQLESSKVAAGLVMVDQSGAPRVVSIWTNSQIPPFSLRFEMPPRDKGWRGKLQKLSRRFQTHVPKKQPLSTSIDLLRERVLESVLLRLGQPPQDWPDRIIRDLDDHGLTMILSLCRTAQTQPQDVLKLGYLLSQLPEQPLS